MKKKLYLLLVIIMAVGMLFSGCGSEKQSSADDESEEIIFEDPNFGTATTKKPTGSDYTLESISESTGASAEYYLKSKEQNFRADVYFISSGNTYEEYVADKNSLQAQGSAFNVKEYDLGQYKCAIYTQFENASAVQLQVFLKEPADGVNGTVLYMYLEQLESADTAVDLLGVVDSSQFQVLLKGIRYDETLKPEAKQITHDDSAEGDAAGTDVAAGADTTAGTGTATSSADAATSGADTATAGADTTAGTDSAVGTNTAASTDTATTGTETTSAQTAN